MPRQKSDHVDSAVGLARRLREARERAGLSQRALALGICTPAYVSRLEKGERIPSLQLLRRLADRLGVDADELASGLPRPPDDPLLDAEVALLLGETLEAERLFTAALDPENRRLRARALAGLGEIAYSIGDARGAVALLQEAVATDPEERSQVADPLGSAFAELSDLDAAIDVFEDALENARERADTYETLRYSVLLADALLEAGRPAKASAVLGAVVAARDELDTPLGLARLWRSQSREFAERGDRERSARYARRALEAGAVANHARYVTRAHLLLARVELERGNAARALDLLDAVAARDGNELAMIRAEQARALTQLGRGDEAAARASEAEKLVAHANATRTEP
jgi:transcriptional regulator with XRE-family HTH domain